MKKEFDQRNTDVESEFVFYWPWCQELRQKLFDRCETADLIWLNDADGLNVFLITRYSPLTKYLRGSLG